MTKAMVYGFAWDKLYGDLKVELVKMKELRDTAPNPRCKLVTAKMEMVSANIARLNGMLDEIQQMIENENM